MALLDHTAIATANKQRESSSVPLGEKYSKRIATSHLMVQKSMVGDAGGHHGFCWPAHGWPAYHSYVGIKLPLSCTVHTHVYIHTYI